VQFHDVTGEALKEFIFDIEKENLVLKERITELVKALILKHLFVEPITTIQPMFSLEDVEIKGFI
jgi:hypothetical protein